MPTDINQAVMDAIEAAGEIAAKAAEGSDGIGRLIMLAAASSLLAIGLKGEESEHFVLLGGDRIGMINDCLRHNGVRWRLMPLQ